jgi:hypothetical protein
MDNITINMSELAETPEYSLTYMLNDYCNTLNGNVISVFIILILANLFYYFLHSRDFRQTVTLGSFQYDITKPRFRDLVILNVFISLLFVLLATVGKVWA